ncbi:Uncharacterised protein [Bordetella pertussis]|nr:Uncharacterised protein [Bordetella pertussis]
MGMCPSRSIATLAASVSRHSTSLPISARHAPDTNPT